MARRPERKEDGDGQGVHPRLLLGSQRRDRIDGCGAPRWNPGRRTLRRRASAPRRPARAHRWAQSERGSWQSRASPRARRQGRGSYRARSARRRRPADVVSPILVDGKVPDPAQGLPPRLGGGVTLALVLLDAGLQVELEFVADLAGYGVAARERAKAGPNQPRGAHGVSCSRHSARPSSSASSSRFRRRTARGRLGSACRSARGVPCR